MIVIKIRPSIILTHDQDKSVLLMKYNYDGNDVLGIPGGGVDEGETIHDTLKRELAEELGIAIDIGNLACVVETPAAGKVKHTLHCVFVGSVSGGMPEINLAHTTASAIQWLKSADLENCVLYPPINDIVLDVLKENFIPKYLGLRSRPWL